MTNRFKTHLAAAVAPLVLLAGCHSGSLSVNYHEHHPPRRTVYVDHLCSPDCDHYYDDDRVVVVRGHRHGPGCGHVFVDRRWVRVRRIDPEPVIIHKAPPRRVVAPPPRRVPVEHRHGPDCGCVYDRAGSKWVVVGREHRHGPGCGHVYIDGRWVIRRR